jgi:hypothetical protein
MIKLLHILTEEEYNTYQGLVRITINPDVTIQETGELMRALPGVITVTQVSHNDSNNTAVMKMKIITKQQAEPAFAKLKQVSLTKIPQITKFEFAPKTIEVK